MYGNIHIRAHTHISKCSIVKILKPDYKIIGNMNSWKLTMALPEHETLKH